MATITINRPDAMNSFNKTMVEEFETLWKQLAWDDDVHCCVLRAAPGRAFCTGVDVKESRTPENKVVKLENIWHAEDPGKFLGPSP